MGQRKKQAKQAKTASSKSTKRVHRGSESGEGTAAYLEALQKQKGLLKAEKVRFWDSWYRIAGCSGARGTGAFRFGELCGTYLRGKGLNAHVTELNNKIFKANGTNWSRVELGSCLLRDNAVSGMHVEEACTLIAIACVAERNAESGFKCIGKGNFDIDRCVSSHSTYGVDSQAAARCQVTYTNCNHCEFGVTVFQSESPTAVAHCSMTMISHLGFYIENSQAVVVENCSVTDCQAGVDDASPPQGFTVKNSTVLAYCCNVQPGSHAVGASAKGPDAELTLQNCDISGHGGAVIQESASLIMKQCRTFSCAQSGIALHQGSKAQITDWTSTNDYYGFQCNHSSLELENCHFTRFYIAGDIQGQEKVPSSISHCTFTEPRVPKINRSPHTLAAEKS